MGGKDNGILVIKPSTPIGRRPARFTLSDLPSQAGPASGQAAQALRRKIRGWKLLGESISSERESLSRLLSLLGPPTRIEGLGELAGVKFKAAKVLTLSRENPVLLLTNIHPDEIAEAYADAPLDPSRRATFLSTAPPRETYYLIPASGNIAEILSAGPKKAPVPEAPEPAGGLFREREEIPGGEGGERKTLVGLIAESIPESAMAESHPAEPPGEEIDREWERISGDYGEAGPSGEAQEEPEAQPEAGEAPQQGREETGGHFSGYLEAAKKYLLETGRLEQWDSRMERMAHLLTAQLLLSNSEVAKEGSFGGAGHASMLSDSLVVVVMRKDPEGHEYLYMIDRMDLEFRIYPMQEAQANYNFDGSPLDGMREVARHAILLNNGQHYLLVQLQLSSRRR